VIAQTLDIQLAPFLYLTPYYFTIIIFQMQI
jgi:hypothetical protein